MRLNCVEKVGEFLKKRLKGKKFREREFCRVLVSALLN